MQAKTFQRLLELWKSSESIKAGEEIYKAIPGDRRPDWAGTILAWCLEVSGMSIPAAQEVVDAAFDDSRWPNAHDIFGRVREQTLKHQEEPRVLALLDVAETAAKVIYNASGCSAPFDHHVGWGMAPRLRALMELYAPDRETEVWDMLVKPLRKKNRNAV